MRFIHMADVHLGAVPDSGCPWSAFRENEIWETFVRVIDQIREEKIELLLIAGDLFHRQPLPSQTERVSQLFASIPDTEVVWMAGSHDYLREDSAYRKVKWTKNVHGFLSEKPEVISLEKLHTKVYGCSYEHPEVTEAIYSSIRPEDQPGIHILLAYGGDETHIPMKKEDGAGFDYVALGYRHIPGVLVQNQMAYAGSPEPICLEETGTHGVVYGEITEDEQGQYHAQITLVPCACRSYIPLSLRIHSGTTQAALEQKVQDAIAQKGSEDIYWLRIQGYRNPELEFELEALRAYGNIVKITDETRPCYDLNRLKREKLGTKTGAYIHWFEKKQGKVEQKALDYGLQALLAEDRDEREVLSEKITDWKEKKQELQKEREGRSAVVEQTMHRIMRERSGLEQQLLVNGSEIRRLELNRNATEKHLEQERREEGKRQAEESRQPKSEQPLNLERSVAEQPVQTRRAVGGKERKLLDIPKIPQISEIFTWTGIALAILILIDPFSWNRAVCTVLGLVILTGTLMGRMYLVNWLRTRDSMVVQRTVVRDEPEQKEDTEQEELQKDWEERLKERKKELRQISHQILRLQERGVHLSTEAEEKKIQTENLQEEIRELSCPTWEEESCDMEISGLKLALTVLTEEESIRHVGDRSERKEKERECLE